MSYWRDKKKRGEITGREDRMGEREDRERKGRRMDK